jgi:hypothetical protein
MIMNGLFNSALYRERIAAMATYAKAILMAETDDCRTAVCTVCGGAASFVVLGSWRCSAHRDDTVVGVAPLPAPATIVEIPPVCYYHCVDGIHKCGK